MVKVALRSYNLATHTIEFYEIVVGQLMYTFKRSKKPIYFAAINPVTAFCETKIDENRSYFVQFYRP